MSKIQMREDAQQLRYHAASLSYNDTTAEGEAKARLLEIAMRIETGYYIAPAIAAVRQAELQLVRLFGPEHGITKEVHEAIARATS